MAPLIRYMGVCPLVSSRAPGPKGHPLIGSLPELRRDVIGLMTRSFAAHGDLVRFKLGPLTIHLASHPDDVKQVLKQPLAFDKKTRTSDMIHQITGDSVLINNGEAWERHRRLLQPAFAPLELKSFFSLFAKATDDLIAQLETVADRDEPIDISSSMMRLTYRIVEQALFSTDESENMGELERAIFTVLTDTYRRIEQPIAIPRWLPSPGNRAYKTAMGILNKRVYQLIDSHRGQPGDDLLHRLGGDSSFTETELRNETITLLIAGHETTATALTWLWHALLQHPDAEEEMVRELPNGPLTLEHLSALPQTTRTIDEVLRLYPPIWAIVRRVVEETELRGYRLPRNSRLIISPYIVHRHPAFWDRPDTFDPQRALPDHHYAYIPYGGGPRICIGHNFARMELKIIAAKLLQRFHFEPIDGQPVEMQAGIVLRPRNGLKVRVFSRA